MAFSTVVKGFWLLTGSRNVAYVCGFFDPDSTQFRDRFRASDLCCKGGLVKDLSIQYYIKIRIRLVIVNEMNWLVIQCGILKGGFMEKLGCR